LSINEDLKLEKGKEKKSSAGRSRVLLCGPLVIYISDLVNRGISIARRTHASLYDWIVYKRGSKARERKGEEG
jgi:hypothetical protein